MARSTNHPDQPNPEHAIKTLTIRQTVYTALQLAQITPKLDRIDDMLFDLEIMRENVNGEDQQHDS